MEQLNEIHQLADVGRFLVDQPRICLERSLFLGVVVFRIFDF
jgi:hypothetical protein